MDPNANPLALATALVNLPAITSGAGAAGSRPFAQWEGKNTIQFAYLTGSIAGVLATDAQVTAQILGVEIRDGNAVLVNWWTPAQLRALYDHVHSRYGAFGANSGCIPIPILPDDYPLGITRTHFGLGRSMGDGSNRPAVFTITVLWAGAVTIDLLVPTLVVDPTEEMAGMGDHFRLDTYQAPAFAGTGDHPLPELFRGLNATACKELWFSQAVGTIDAMTVTQGLAAKIPNQTPITTLNRESHRAGLTAVAGQFVLPFGTLNDPSGDLLLKDAPSVLVTGHWSVTPAGAYNVLTVMRYNGRIEK